MSYDLIGQEEIVGYDEIVGAYDDDDDDDDDDDVGAVIRRAGQKLALAGRQPTQKRLLMQVAKDARRQRVVHDDIQAMRRQNAVGVASRRPSRWMELPAGLASVGTIAAGGNQTIVITAPLLWKPDRLFIPSNLGGNFTLDVLQVALQSWMLTAAPINCGIFGQDATNNEFRLDTLQIGQQLVMRFTNISGAPLALSGVWKGKVLT